MKVVEIKLSEVPYYGIHISKEDPRFEILLQKSGIQWNPEHGMWLLPANKESKAYILSISNKKQKTGTVFILKGNRLRITYFPGWNAINYMKSLSLWRYDKKTKHWTIPYTEFNMERIKAFAEEEQRYLKVEDQREKMKSKKPVFIQEHKRKAPIEVTQKLIEMRYSTSTISIYTAMLDSFFSHFYAYEPKEISHDKIREYLRFLVQERQVSESYQNQAINAIKFYYEKVLGGVRMSYFIDRPRKSFYLPSVLSQKEVTALLKGCSNLKHKTILMVIYSCGLRISEVLALKKVDLDFDQMKAHIIAAKNKKDRYVPIAKKTKEQIEIYLEKINPEEYLFEGLSGGPYSSASVRKFIKKYSKQVGITKNVSPHTLRHSLATHMMERGVDTRFVQHLLGHKNITTTEIYTHITQVGLDQIINPLDDFDI